MKDIYSDIEKRVAEDEQALSILQVLALNDPSSLNVREESIARSSWLSLRVAEEFSPGEIREALLRLPLSKTPGPDGYPVEFYRSYWQVLGTEFIKAVQDFFASFFLPSCVNATSLILIPKRRGADVLKDFRPISCMNTSYKVISRILSNRLKKILPTVILPNQTTFVKGRLLIENVLLASEVLQKYHLELVSPRITLKVDISKAFDSVWWDFVLNALASYGVPVMQGDPLSPIFFVMLMNVLSLMLNKAAQDKNFGYHLGCEVLELTHLCFANDLLIFLDGTEASLAGVFTVISQFEKFFGLSVNISKTSMFSSGLSEDDLNHMQSKFPLPRASLPVCYLGLPRASLPVRYLGLPPCIIHGAKVAWADLCYPKREGGLGSIWVAWIRSKYLSTTTFWALNENSSSVSWMFRKLLKLRHKAINFLRIKVGTWEDTFFWWDPWTPFGSLIHFLGADAPRRLGIPIFSLVSDYKSGANWILLSARSDSFLEVLTFITSLLHSTHSDIPVWIINTKEFEYYSSKDMWNSLRLSRPHVPWFSLVWHKAAVPKHSLAVWLFLQNRNPTLDQMIQWGLDVEPISLLCSLHNESRDHLFFECSYSYEVWSSLVGIMGLPSPPSVWDQIIQWLPSISNTTVTSLALLQGWHATIYEIWNERNRRFHDGTTLPQSSILRIIRRAVRNKSSALKLQATEHGELLEQFWSTY
ncbi:PREDICTED: uncharacterized protein LOC104709645 [Camelina sativa]|uniref:Uncharacterized protein LOC104709645 n=1 Tax=Camelina sativa TaxID=90675 RepID=A0ABM0TD31_CAMSA|nr:PREDICTED: uncharacterized protein LOC104709645 [Camelina sativa]